jgi:hypothetical protein
MTAVGLNGFMTRETTFLLAVALLFAASLVALDRRVHPPVTLVTIYFSESSVRLQEMLNDEYIELGPDPGDGRGAVPSSSP